MATWDEVKAHLRLDYVLDMETEDAVELTWELVDDEGRAHLQRERIERAEAADRPRLVVLCPIGPANAIDARRALEHNATLAIGALAVDDDTLLLRAVLSLEEASPKQVYEAMELVAHEAARLREAGLP